jgi:hypothetical protein
MLHYDPELDEYYEINEDAITNCPPLEADEVARLFKLPLDVIEAYLATDPYPSPEGAHAFMDELRSITAFPPGRSDLMSSVLILDVEAEDLLGPYEREFLPSVLHQLTERAVMILDQGHELDLAEATEAFDSILHQDFRIIDHPYS